MNRVPTSAPRQAIILAAGMGRRLDTADTRPKALVEIHGRSILERALSALERHETPKITIVVGYEGDRVVEHVASRSRRDHIEFAWNRAFATTDSAYSLWCTRRALAEGALVMNGDVVFADEVLTATRTETSRSLWLATDAQPGDDGWMLVLDADSRLTRLEFVRRGADVVGADFLKSAGILSLSAPDGMRLAHWLDRAVRDGCADRHFDYVLRRHLSEIAITGAPIDRGAWAEIDDATDLQRAVRVFAPRGEHA